LDVLGRDHLTHDLNVRFQSDYVPELEYRTRVEEILLVTGELRLTSFPRRLVIHVIERGLQDLIHAGRQDHYPTRLREIGTEEVPLHQGSSLNEVDLRKIAYLVP
jgi:hypothetical protein